MKSLSLNEIERKNGFEFVFYTPKNVTLYFALTDNSARVVHNDLNEILFPGQNTNLALRKTKQIALGPLYSECNDAVGYRRLNCIDDCYSKKFSESCECEYPIGCLDTEKWNSLCWKTYNSSDSIWFDCKLQCPVECNQITFSFNRIDVGFEVGQDLLQAYKSQATLKFDLSLHNMSLDQFKKRLTSMHVYFERLETTEITQSESISLTSLIANVGGLLGEYPFYYIS